MIELDLSRALFSGLRDGRRVLFVCVGQDQFAIVHGEAIIRQGSLDELADGMRQFMEMIDHPATRPIPMGLMDAAFGTNQSVIRCA